MNYGGQMKSKSKILRISVTVIAIALALCLTLFLYGREKRYCPHPRRVEKRGQRRPLKHSLRRLYELRRVADFSGNGQGGLPLPQASSLEDKTRAATRAKELTNSYSYTEKGMKATKAFGDFLKEIDWV